MGGPPINDRVGLSPALRRSIESTVADHWILDRVVKWGFASDPPRVVANIVVQDEYTHDVVIPWGSGLYLVYDCT